jgi:phospholipid-binding lipoprotein MlaA
MSLCESVKLAAAGLLLAAAIPAVASAQATAPAPHQPAGAEDPFEPVNRGLFRVDLTINNVLAGKGRILAVAKWIPAPVRAGLYNAFDNMQEPSTLANDVMQRKLHRAGNTTGRFLVNSTIGVLGVFDVASKFGLKRTREDFGQTLASWGVTPGPYIFLPLAGPTTVRDILATPVDGLFFPGHWFPMTTPERQGMKLMGVIVAPSTIGIRQVARGAAEARATDDEYATLRQLYYDQRADQIADRPNLADDPVGSFPESKPKKPKD